MRGQILDRLEELFDLALAQRRRRLVHDQDPRVLRQCLRDLDELLLRDAQRGDLRVGRDVRVEEVELPLRVAAHFGFVDHAALLDRLAPEEDVLRDGQMRDKVELLIDDRDPEILRILGAADVDLLPVDVELAAVE